MFNATKKLFIVFSLMASGETFAQSTNEVWTHHIDAWQARDVAAITADYNDDSVLILNNQIYRGTSEIKGVFAQLFKIFDDGKNRIDEPVIDERIVYITWHFTPRNAGEFFGTDTFVIENGKISVQTIASPLYESYPIIRE